MSMARSQLCRTLQLLGAVATLMALGGTALAAVEKAPSTPSIPLEQVTDIKAQPLAVLAKFPEGGPPMATFVAQAVTADPSTADPILSVADDASPQQASAIGAGMVRAVRALEKKQPAAARAIADKTMKSNSIRVKVTFSAIGSNLVTTVALKKSDVLPPLPTSKPTVTRPEAKTHADASAHRINRPVAGTRTQQNGLLETKNTINHTHTDPSKTVILPSNGTMVAVLASDAVRNGAVSTSPTR